MTWARARARARVRAKTRTRARSRARDGKIINTALLIPAGAIYTTGAPVLQGGPNLPLK